MIEAQLSVLAGYLGRSLNEMYSLARLPDAPSPTGRVGQIFVYSLDEWLAFAPPADTEPDSLDSRL